MDDEVILQQMPIPKEMTTPPYGAVFTAYEDHATLDLPYVPKTITVLPGEMVKIGLEFTPDRHLVLKVSRGKIDSPQT